jgi:hypothetical protein
MPTTAKQQLAAKRGWLYTGWRKCEDVETVPKYLRCHRCFRLVTYGQIEQGGCVCGNRRLCAALALTLAEACLLKFGWFRLAAREQQRIRPLVPRLGVAIRHAIFRPLGR